MKPAPNAYLYEITLPRREGKTERERVLIEASETLARMKKQFAETDLRSEQLKAEARESIARSKEVMRRSQRVRARLAL
jgi:hypothetical protein